MTCYKLIINKTNIKVFDAFNEEYSEKAISLCPFLKKFQIIVLNYYDSSNLKDACFNENDIFAFYFNKNGHDASSSHAEVLVNVEKCDTLGLSDNEMKAALAHEIGHIIAYFRTDKEELKGQGEEVISDIYACEMGLAVPLSSLLLKLIDSDLLSEEQSRTAHNRLFFIKPYLENDHNRIKTKEARDDIEAISRCNTGRCD